MSIISESVKKTITYDFRVDSIIAIDAEVGTDPDDLRQQVLEKLADKARSGDIEVTFENTFDEETGEYVLYAE